MSISMHGAFAPIRPPEYDSSDYHQQIQALENLRDPHLSHGKKIEHLSRLSIQSLSIGLMTYGVSLFRENMIPVRLDRPDIIDLCGTGGDNSGSFNISTTASFVVAGAGIGVAKHGNVGVTSRSGSLDVLRALDVTIPSDEDAARTQFDKAGICFLFAQNFHPAFKNFAQARKDLAAQGHRTLFNVMGPLLNPASVSYSSLGVAHPALIPMMTQTLMNTGTAKALIYTSQGLDELSLAGCNQIGEINMPTHAHPKPVLIGRTFYTRCAADFGLPTCRISDLQGGTPG